MPLSKDDPLTRVEKISRGFVTRPCAFFCGAWGCLFFMTFLVFALNLFTIDNIGFTGWLVAGSDSVEEWDALGDARDNADQGPAGDEVVGARSKKVFLLQFQILFEWESGHPNENDVFFNPENVKSICEAENIILRNEKWPLFCVTQNATGLSTECDQDSYVSVIDSFYPTYDARTDCDLLAESTVTATLAQIYNLLNMEDGNIALNDPTTAALRNLYQFTVGGDFDKTGIATAARSTILFGTPLEGYSDAIENTDGEHWETYSKFYKELQADLFEHFQMKGKGFTPAYMTAYDGYVPLNAENPENGARTKFFAFALQEAQFQALVSSDQLLAGGSILFVFLAMLIHTKSFFLAGMGIGAISLSIPSAVFVIRKILQIPRFTQVEIVSVFIIIGIGADDFLVFVDAWNQSKAHWGSVRGISSEAEAESLNVYGTGSGRSEVFIARMAYAWKRAGSAVFNTSFTTTIAFVATTISPLAPVASFGVFAATLVVLNFFITLLLYAPMVIVNENKFSDRSCKSVFKGEPSRKHDAATDPDSYLHSPEELIFVKAYNPLCIRKSKAVPLFSIIAFVGIMAGMAYQMSNLQTPDGEEQNFADNHMLNDFSAAFDAVSAFRDEEDYMATAFVFGIDSINRAGYNKFDPEVNRGVAVYDEDFTVAPSANQQFLLDFCDDFLAVSCEKDSGCHGGDTLWRSSDDLFCPMTEFTTWNSQVFGDDLQALGDADEEGFYARMRNWTFEDPTRYQDVGFEKNGKLKFLVYHATSNMLTDQAVPIKRPVLKLMNKWQDEIRTSAPKGLKSFFYTGFDKLWIETELGIVQGLFNGLAISVPTAFVVVTLASGNIILGVYTLITIVGIVCSVLGLAYSIGFELGIGEAIAGVFVVGLSVDFALHTSHLYTTHLAEGIDNRDDLVERTMTLIGGTLVASALTTLMAASMLFFAALAFFNKMAILMSATISFSLFFTLGLFVPLLLLVGPTGTTGNIYYYAGLTGAPKEKSGQVGDAELAVAK